MNLSKSQRAAVWELFGGNCAYCGHPLGDRWHADHVQAIYRDRRTMCDANGDLYIKSFGTQRPQHDTVENHYPSCVPCNLHKSASTIESWRKQLQRQTEIALRSCGPLRHAQRFGLVQFSDAPIVFYFEKLAEDIHEEK